MNAISLSELSVVIAATPGSPFDDETWRITWAIENRSAAMLSLHEMRVPHDQFHSPDLSIDPPIEIPPGGSASICRPVFFAELPGSTLIYPFVIVRVTWNSQACRLFGRLRVEADSHGAPQAVCEEVTVRPVIGGG